MDRPADIDFLVTVFGGSGFLGRHVVRALCKRGYRVRVAVRRPYLAGHLQPLGRVGQVHAVQANVRNAESVAAAVRGASAVINLVGLLFEGGRQRFEAVHTGGARNVAHATAAEGARLVHVSALGADKDSPALYGRSKAAGEEAVHAELPSSVIFRPSVVFGPEDNFFNRFAGMARFSPALPLIGGGATKFQPVFVGDVAQAIAKAAAGEVKAGTIYELGGPEVLSFRQLMEYVLRVTERRRLLVPLPFAIARPLGAIAQWLPGAPLTADQVRLLERDNVVSAEAQRQGRTLEALGINPTAMEVVVPGYLWRFRKTGEFRVRPNAEARKTIT